MTLDKLARLQSLVRRKPEDAFAWYGLAMEYKNQNNYPEARRSFQRLLELRPSYTPAYYQYGALLLQIEEVEAARSILQAGVKVAQSQGDGHAGEELNRALSELPESPE